MGDIPQDWDVIVVRKKQQKARTQGEKNQAARQAAVSGGAVESVKKYAGGTNKQRSAAADARKLDDQDEPTAHKTVGLKLSKVIQQARQEKGLTQKELATKINEKASVINDYEAGRAIPNQQVLGKMERVLDVRLRGKKIGEKFPPRGGGGAKGAKK
eukprot:CAMPEP_0198307782 /NCGR_PEP_ID=MMETSP1450-20131203/589_1 /TAXON_ID=753684 ORGANISM="Madagascaria erythrocladiodes, Strain CCMP3234" /NCGR_SAMPLE_ID=MMETSP1450 /ASSEMBLY_ACC=CAM_ASM_001115 /LENGTH=156 /DNA_ID=CAMNT_0044010389 /DNA_START=127 /DNA_END=597 /DNA_ORIENTATION=+